ncbi:transketolase, partial [Klebsiella pneumoniae]|nr:transketolase [Klebsiella pneumoniae]
DRYPAKAEQFERRMRGELPASFEKAVDEFIEKCELKAETIATRKASQNTLEAYAPVLGELLGGSADLTGSNLTNWSGSKAVRVDAWGNHINYGVREFGMSAIMNGIALHGGYLPYTSTFLM